MALKLLWNPTQDVDKLLKDWYVAAVGPAAAPHLEAYFASWEKFWTTDVLQSAWFKGNGNAQYLNFGSSAYLDAFPSADLTRCEESLKKAVSLATEGPQRDRAQYFLDGFLRRQPEFKSQVKLRNPAKVDVVAEIRKSAFDKNFDGWGNWQRDYSKATFSHDADTGRAAPGALKVDAANSQNSPLCFLRSIPVDRAKTYRASAWFGSEGLDAKATVSVLVKWQDSKGAWMSLATIDASAQAPFAKDWKQVDAYFETGTDAKWEEMKFAVIMFLVDNTPAGHVWFDDFTFDEVSIPE